MQNPADILSFYEEAVRIKLRAEIKAEVYAEVVAEFDRERASLGPRYINRQRVIEKVGRSASAFDRLRRDPAQSFPKARDPFRTAKGFGDPMWLEHEVDEWMLARPSFPH